MTKRNEPYAIYLGDDIKCIPPSGNVHYSMNNYYVKLITIEGQYDGAYINSKDINIDVFQCDKICDNFDGIIPANSNILFEFKNGKSGVRKVMTQAKRYQITAKRIFGKDKFYHIIIVRDKLFNALQKIDTN